MNMICLALKGKSQTALKAAFASGNWALLTKAVGLNPGCPLEPLGNLSKNTDALARPPGILI